jgi:Transposase DDE domain
MAPFPPGQGGGEGIAYGRKGKGIRIHSRTDAAGMPLAAGTTPAHGDERAPVIPLLDALHIRTGNQGRPRKRFNVLAADKGYDAKELRQRLRRRGIRPQIPQRVWNNRKPRGRPMKKDVPRFQAERTLAWCQRKYRRLVVRWERRATGFNAFLAIAMIHLWTRRLIVG